MRNGGNNSDGPAVGAVMMAMSMRLPWLLPFAVAGHQLRRAVKDIHDVETGALRFATAQVIGALPVTIKKHQSRLLRQHSDDEGFRLQRGKVINLQIAAPLFDGVLIAPGETLSFWQRVGPPLRRRGFAQGMELARGRPRAGLGGGLCQIANVLHWLALHSPLTVVERSVHSFDPFADVERAIPWGTGCSVFFNYLDLRLRNDTTTTFQVRLRVTERFLEGELRANAALPCSWSVFERDAGFERVDGHWFRHNALWRHVVDRKTGVHLRDEPLKKNRARVLYEPQRETHFEVCREGEAVEAKKTPTS